MSRNLKLFIMVLPTIVLLVIFTYIPIGQEIQIAFENYNLYNLSNIYFNGFDNFINIFTSVDFNFVQIVLNTVIWVVVSLVFQFTLGFGLALLLKKPFKGRGIYSGLVFYPWAVSGFAIGLVWAWIFNGQFGLINGILMRFGIINQGIGFLSDPHIALASVIVVNIWYGIPFFAIMLLAALQSVPEELYEAAKIDGAGRFRRLVNVTIPYIRPTIASTILLRTMWILNFPDIIYAMTNGGPANSTNTLANYMIIKMYSFYNYGQAAAIGFIIMSILMIYAVIYLSIFSRLERGVI
ncbi:carbohydrate ABC transporter permease [Athalassotoga saccharophila]|uniref:carbohydrate ABC transporter permease n=1 Tax=Athalassotoga saccharophila TaxID=1441386 RepID=UPI00137A37A7|nr:sugar ABC transporter permease [Athalassotoga saccharophila]BBJ28439.1 lactose transport system permease protein LacF [Athalassotoga saccharophila]